MPYLESLLDFARSRLLSYLAMERRRECQGGLVFDVARADGDGTKGCREHCFGAVFISEGAGDML
jgi:hypothetical protein